MHINALALAINGTNNSKLQNVLFILLQAFILKSISNALPWSDVCRRRLYRYRCLNMRFYCGYSLYAVIYFSCVCGYWVVGLDVWLMVWKMYSGSSVVKYGSYQLSLSEGLTESHGSAMHQYTTLLPHLTVTALRPERRGEGVITKAMSKQYRRRAPEMMIAAWDYKRSCNHFTYQMLGSSSPWRLESKSSRSTACLPWSSTT